MMEGGDSSDTKSVLTSYNFPKFCAGSAKLRCKLKASCFHAFNWDLYNKVEVSVDKLRMRVV